MQEPPQPPFPVLPPALQICSLIGALYPHFDIVDDKVVLQTGSQELERSLHAMGLGCCFLLLGYYCCQFVGALGPLRREYLGSLALMQAAHFAMLVAQAFIFPAAFRAHPMEAALGIGAAVCLVLLLVYDKAAEPAVSASAEPQPQPSASARQMVAAATHTMWLIFALRHIMPYLAPTLGLSEFPHLPYGLVAAVLSQVVALARLAEFVRGRAGAVRPKVKRA